MNNLLKIRRVLILVFIFSTATNGRCYNTYEEPLPLLIFSLVNVKQCDNDRRLKFEPNDDFSQATCLDKNLWNLTESCRTEPTTLFPSSDNDFFLATSISGSFRLYEYTDVFDFGTNLQIFDNNQTLIYNQNNMNFNSASSAIIANRLLTKDDCVQTRCDDFISKYRLIQFDPKIKQIYVKFSIRNDLPKKKYTH